MSQRNRFTDAATGSFYDWHVNHHSEQAFGRDRTIDHTANTQNVGLVRQQGAKTPFVMNLGGTILHKAQHQAMWAYFELCEFRSIHFRDAMLDEYEVLITKFQPVRKPTAFNHNDPSIPYHYWTYEGLEMEVLSFVSGELHDIGIGP